MDDLPWCSTQHLTPTTLLIMVMTTLSPPTHLQPQPTSTLETSGVTAVSYYYYYYYCCCCHKHALFHELCGTLQLSAARTTCHSLYLERSGSDCIAIIIFSPFFLNTTFRPKAFFRVNRTHKLQSLYTNGKHDAIMCVWISM